MSDNKVMLNASPELESHDSLYYGENHPAENLFYLMYYNFNDANDNHFAKLETEIATWDYRQTIDRCVNIIEECCKMENITPSQFFEKYEFPSTVKKAVGDVKERFDWLNTKEVLTASPELESQNSFYFSDDFPAKNMYYLLYYNINDSNDEHFSHLLADIDTWNYSQTIKKCADIIAWACEDYRMTVSQFFEKYEFPEKVEKAVNDVKEYFAGQAFKKMCQNKEDGLTH